MLLVHSGALWLHVDGDAERSAHASPLRALAEGDLVLLMDPTAHRLSTLPDLHHAAEARTLPAREDAPAWQPVGQAGQPERARLLAGRVRFDDATGSTLLRALPRVLHVARRQDDHQVLGWLDATAHFLALEIAAPSVGTAVMVSRLVDLLFVQAARHWARHARPDEQGWLRALRDPGLAAALQALHRAPAADWSVESLAREAHMSRSLFAARFSGAMNTSPMGYLRQWRMQLAKRALRDSRKSVAQIAEAVGYASEPAFIKAFVNETGQTPRRYRDEATGR
jgi:AraC-like DNA-binding protein